MQFYEKGPLIHYEEAGTGLPLLLPRRELHPSTISFFNGAEPTTRSEDVQGRLQMLAMAPAGNAKRGRPNLRSGEIERPWTPTLPAGSEIG